MPGIPLPGDLVYRKFTTRSFTTGVSTTPVGLVVSIYKDDSTTESTTGVTLVSPFDSVAGLNHVTINTALDGTFYSAGSTFYLVITTGTVDGVSLVGYTVGEFDLANIPDVNVAKIGGQTVTASGAITANANLGTTQPINFSGTSTSAMVKADVELINTQTVTASGGITFPAATLASTTNITAGTITTVTTTTTATSLTNLPAIPTNWLTGAGMDATAITKIWQIAIPGAFTTGQAGATLGNLHAAIWDEVNTGATHNVNNSTGKQLRSITAGVSGVIYTGTCPSQAGMTSVQIKLDSGASAINDVYQFDVISIISGADAGDSAIITAYNGTTKVATVSVAWQVQPDNTSVFEITPTASTQVVSYLAGQDPATLVWGAATRTLTALAASAITGNVAADLQTIKTQTVTCGAGVTVGAFIGNANAAIDTDVNGRVLVRFTGF